MRVKIVNVESPDDLKMKLNQAVDKLISLGIPNFSNANLYVGLRGKTGNNLKIQSPDGDEIMLVIGLNQKEHPSMYVDVSETKTKRKSKKV